MVDARECEKYVRQQSDVEHLHLNHGIMYKRRNSNVRYLIILPRMDNQKRANETNE
jgi:hypothetical protein